MALSALERELPDASRHPVRDAATRQARPTLLERLRRPRVLLAVAILVLIGVALAVLAGLTARSGPIAPLGASAELPGGVARVNGVIPLERDGWLPTDAPAVLTEPTPDGAHLVRVELELTALDADGIEFTATDYTIFGLSTDRLPPVWASPEAHAAGQGEVVSATLVFEIPNRAIALTLEGEHGGRLALGVGHHTAGR
ncbi:hypothetical protein [Agrococcus citreus]|uniref:DUF4352 domain-containing protein n=1 Tax=Agrococcus citreus TaxID=84643 RepID=A0ABN1YW62_9MICO